MFHISIMAHRISIFYNEQDFTLRQSNVTIFRLTRERQHIVEVLFSTMKLSVF